MGEGPAHDAAHRTRPGEPNEGISHAARAKEGKTRTAEVATGGDPERAVHGGALQLAVLDPVGVALVAVLHDDGCPCLDQRRLSECTCEIVGLEARRLA
jgi:hypothetical protein